MRILILCGIGTKWHNYLGVPKQLAPIMGQPLLERTLQQLHDLGHKDIHIISNDSRLHLAHANAFMPGQQAYPVDVLAATEPLWQKEQLVLLGDVYYTDAVLRTMLSAKTPLMLFGHATRNPYSGKQWGELYGFKFSHNYFAQLKIAIAQTSIAAKAGGRGKLWELHVALLNKPLQNAEGIHGLLLKNSPIFTHMMDLSDDIDTPEEYHRLCLILQMIQKSIGV